MLRHDLKAARDQWIADANTEQERQQREKDKNFLRYRNSANMVADFHALRHTYITNLARIGVHPKTAMDLARHGNINLTMARYSHTLVADRADALGDLPSLGSGPEAEEQKATGTYDAVAQIGDFPSDTTSGTTSREDDNRKSLPIKPVSESGKGLLNRRSQVRILSGVVLIQRGNLYRRRKKFGEGTPANVSSTAERPPELS